VPRYRRRLRYAQPAHQEKPSADLHRKGGGGQQSPPIHHSGSFHREPLLLERVRLAAAEMREMPRSLVQPRDLGHPARLQILESHIRN
jgi:hypothetical protein